MKCAFERASVILRQTWRARIRMSPKDQRHLPLQTHEWDFSSVANVYLGWFTRWTNILKAPTNTNSLNAAERRNKEEPKRSLFRCLLVPLRGWPQSHSRGAAFVRIEHRGWGQPSEPRKREGDSEINMQIPTNPPGGNGNGPQQGWVTEIFYPWYLF